MWLWYQREDEPLLAGPLGLGFSVYGDTHHVGPELQFGHVVGNFFSKPGFADQDSIGAERACTRISRPPRATGAVGPYYTKCWRSPRQALANLATIVPPAITIRVTNWRALLVQGWTSGVQPRTAVPEYGKTW